MCNDQHALYPRSQAPSEIRMGPGNEATCTPRCKQQTALRPCCRTFPSGSCHMILAFSQLPRAQTCWSQDCSVAGYTLASDPGRGSTVVAPQVLVESSVMNILAGAQKMKGEILFGNETSPQDLFGRDCCMTGS